MIQLPIHQHQDEVMDEIVKGASGLKCVAIRYQAKSDEMTERLVEPYEIKNGKLFAFCRQRDGIRAFSTTNILAALATDVEYIPRYPVQVADIYIAAKESTV